MLKINVYLTSIQGEKLWEIHTPLPSHVQIAINVNILKINSNNKKLEAPFIFTLNYNPSIAQITLKGSSEIEGDPEDLKSIINDFKNKKTLTQIIQAVTNSAIAEAIIISKTLGVPPPLPSILSPQQKKKIEHPGYM